MFDRVLWYKIFNFTTQKDERLTVVVGTEIALYHSTKPYRNVNRGWIWIILGNLIDA